MDDDRAAKIQLTLATGAFFLCFAIFGSVSSMMPIIRRRLDLDPIEVSVALAVPVLLGSLGRIPLGALADRFGGRVVFLSVLVAAAIPAFAMGGVASYAQLLFWGFFIGIALASFSVGVAFVSRWYPPSHQGSALGIYGAGTSGQSLAAFGAPLFASLFGFAWGFRMFGLLAALWLLLWIAFARNAPASRPPIPFLASLEPLRDRGSWLLSLYYFLTFGGFVAMSVYLPTFLTEMFGLTPQDAGLRTAGFVVVSTGLRPVGGILADRIGGATILRWAFPACAAMAGLLAIPQIIPFTAGALGMAAAIGLGNGAVFKLVPQMFPANVGSVTGLVGACGGLGGFFPPLVIGALYRATGSYSSGFGLLALFSLGALAILLRSTDRAGEEAALEIA